MEEMEKTKVLEPEQEEPVEEIQEKRLNNTQKSKKWFLFGGIAVLVIVVAILCLTMLTPQDRIPAIFTISESGEVDLYRLDTLQTLETEAESTLKLAGNYTYFMDGESTLYRMDFNAKKADPQKIGDNVTSYQCTPDGKKCFYIKNNNLYFFDGQDSEKILRDVQYFMISEKGNQLLYFDEDFQLYQMTLGKEAVRLEKEIDKILKLDSEEGKFYYATNGKIYCADPASQTPQELLREKGLTNLSVLDDGMLLYTKAEKTEIAYSAIVENDLTIGKSVQSVAKSDVVKEYEIDSTFEELANNWYDALEEGEKADCDTKVKNFLSYSWSSDKTREDALYEYYCSEIVGYAVKQTLAVDGIDFDAERIKELIKGKYGFGLRVTTDYQETTDKTTEYLDYFVYENDKIGWTTAENLESYTDELLNGTLEEKYIADLMLCTTSYDETICQLEFYYYIPEKLAEYQKQQTAQVEYERQSALAEETESGKFDFYTSTLYLYKDGEEREISKNVSEFRFDTDAGMLYYSTSAGVPEEKIKLSTVDSTEEIQEQYLEIAEDEPKQQYVLPLSFAGESVLLDNDVENVFFGGEEGQIILQSSEDYRIITLKGKNDSESVTLEESERIYLNKKGSILIYNAEDELLKRLDGTVIAEDLEEPADMAVYEIGSGGYVYLEDDEILKYFDGKKTLEICDNVAYYRVFYDNLVYYTEDDELYFWNGKQAILLADDPIYSVGWIYGAGVTENPEVGKLVECTDLADVTGQILKFSLRTPETLDYVKDASTDKVTDKVEVA